MAFLHPSTGCSQMPRERTPPSSSQKGWFIHNVAAHHLRLGSRPLLLVHMLPFTAQSDTATRAHTASPISSFSLFYDVYIVEIKVLLPE